MNKIAKLSFTELSVCKQANKSTTTTSNVQFFFCFCFSEISGKNEKKERNSKLKGVKFWSTTQSLLRLLLLLRINIQARTQIDDDDDEIINRQHLFYQNKNENEKMLCTMWIDFPNDFFSRSLKIFLFFNVYSVCLFVENFQKKFGALVFFLFGIHSFLGSSSSSFVTQG